MSWIGSADIAPAHTVKIEDARTAQWMRQLDPVTDPIRRIDMGWTMGDYNQLDVSVETVALREFTFFFHINLVSSLHIVLTLPRNLVWVRLKLLTMSDWLKWDEWVGQQHDRLLSIWAAADRPYTAGHGVEPRLSIAKGKMTPQEAAKEHERQKELGWDVLGNLEP